MNPQLPPAFLQSLQGIEGFDLKSFEEAHKHPEKITSVRINPFKWSELSLRDHFADTKKIPWSSFGYYLQERPSFTLDPLFHAGAYYVQEPSSMFLEGAIKQHVDLLSGIRVLDLCAAPGGKSTLIQSLISAKSLLVSNEVIQSRVNPLLENCIKWGAGNIMVTNNDPKDFGRLENYFDVMLVDAPCSGSGLFRKEPEAIHEWSLEQVRTCSLRQQRIITDAWSCLKRNGILIYSTCSFSKEENEEILDWMLGHFACRTLPLKIEPDWNIVESISAKNKGIGYRFYPDKLVGEGLFIACLQKQDGDNLRASFKNSKQKSSLSSNEKSFLKYYFNDDTQSFVKKNDLVWAIEEGFMNDYQFLQKNLFVKKAGILLGKIGAKGLIPAHELALSHLIRNDFPSVELSKEDAIKYLRKDDFDCIRREKGWNLIKYSGLALGWAKVLDNRVNNYYPMDWRILKAKE